MEDDSFSDMLLKFVGLLIAAFVFGAGMALVVFALIAPFFGLLWIFAWIFGWK